LKDQLELLWELQKIDLDLKRIKEEQERYPKEINFLDDKERMEKVKIQTDMEKIETLDKERKRKEAQLNLEQDKLKRVEGRMAEIKTNREYQALLSEIDLIKEAKNREEEEILQVLDEIDEFKRNLTKKEKEMKLILEKIKVEKRLIQERMVQGEVVWKQEMEQREILSKQLESKLHKLYNMLKEKREGIGVVSVKDETCQGCYLNIPPQMFIEVQKNNTLIRCPNCNRILYWERDGKTK